MPKKPNKLSRFWQELKRRRVVHVITVYASAAFVIIELANNLTEPLNLPAGLVTIVIIVLAVGFPLAVILSWIYDLSGVGIERTKPMEELGDEQKTSVPNTWKIATIVSFLVILVLVTFNIVGSTKKLHAGDIQSLVILPFENYTGDEQLDYVAAGMHSSLIGDMGKVGALRIIGKTSSNVYKNTDKSAPDIARELNVDALVEPTLTCYGDTVCVQIRVITMFPEEEQIWVAEYREDKSKILSLYSRVAKQIADEVMIELTPEEESLLAESRTVDKEAYDYYMKGVQYFNLLTEEPLQMALEYMNKAIELNPDWAPPYAGVAQVWMGLAQMGFTPPDIAGPKIYEYLEKAIELDPEYPQAHYASALIAIWTEWNWDKGEKEFLKALAINPNDVMARIFYAHFLMIMQRTEEAVAQGRFAVELDPLNPLILSLHAVLLGSSAEYREAVEFAQKAYDLAPESYFVGHRLYRALENVGEYEKAFELEEMDLKFEKDIIKSIDIIFKEQGRNAAYEQISNLYELQAQDSYVQPLLRADRYYKLGQYKKAMDWIEKAYEIREPNMPYLATGAIGFSDLHDNPRYIALLKKMNLPLPNN